MSLTDKIEALNGADLSTLQGRIKALRASLEDALRAQGQDPNTPLTQADLKQAASQTGLTMDQLLEALEAAQKVT